MPTIIYILKKEVTINIQIICLNKLLAKKFNIAYSNAKTNRGNNTSSVIIKSILNFIKNNQYLNTD